MAQSQTDRNGAGTTPPTTPAGLQAAIDASAASATASAASATAAATSATASATSATASATSAADAAAQLATKASLAGATFTGGVNLARSSIVQHATTMNLGALSNTVDGTGSAVTVTAIVNAPQAGAIRRFYGLANTVWTNNAMFAIDGGANYTFATGDYIDIEAITTSTYKVHPFKASGTAVVPTINYLVVQNTTAGTTITFTGIPTTAKRITFLFNNLSTNGTGVPTVRLGSSSGGIETSGYTGTQTLLTGTVNPVALANGFDLGGATAASIRNGSLIITNLTGNLWVTTGLIGFSDAAANSLIAGVKTLTSTLDRVNITTSGAVDTFDLGSTVVIWE